MQLEDEGIILGVQALGERGRVAHILLRQHGRFAGRVRGGRSPRQQGLLLPGNLVSVRWRARLAEQLGQFQCELQTARAAAAFQEPLRLAVLASACALCWRALPERQPMGLLYDCFNALLDESDIKALPAAYAQWEMELLSLTGYGFGHNQGGHMESADPSAILRLTGTALSTHLLPGGRLPAERQRLSLLLDRAAAAATVAA